MATEARSVPFHKAHLQQVQMLLQVRNMTSEEKILFAADVIFAVLSVRMLLPTCSLSLWKRLVLVACVWGANALVLYRAGNDDWVLLHTRYYFPACNCVAVCAVFGWLWRRKSLKDPTATD